MKRAFKAKDFSKIYEEQFKLYKNFNILETYIDQMNYFIENIRSNNQPMNSFSNAVNILKLAINEEYA